MDVATFLSRHRPFAGLDGEALDRIVRHTQIEHFAPAAVILEQAGEPSGFLYVVRKGGVEVADDGHVIDELGEGEVFGLWSLLGEVAPSATVRAIEDTLCYLIEGEIASEVLQTRAGRELLAATYRRRLEHVGSDRLAQDAGIAPMRSVGSLVRRPPVTCEPTTPVSEAAATMARERVSSLLVRMPDGALAIVTDRDLRTRVVAERRSGDTPVAEIVSVPASTVDADALAGEVLLRMLSDGFHHFPVVDANHVVLGVVTDTDLMDIERRSPFALKSEIERAGTVDDVASATRELPEVVSALVDASGDPVDVGRIVAFIVDAATRRLLDLAVETLGEPPGAWSWLALGSAARHEQALHTDQDHALAHDGARGIEPYTARVAEIVAGGLEASGIPRCPGQAMATHPTLRRDVPGLLAQVREWMRDLGPQGSERLSIVLDHRRVAGSVPADEALDELVRGAPSDPAFVRHLSRRGLDLRPPTGFVRDFVVEAHGEHAGRLDVKHGGILIVANLARGWAVGAGLTATRTLDRLVAARAADVIDAETEEALGDAFRFLWEVRLRHQVDQHRAGLAPDDFIDPKELGPLARRSLKEAFAVIARAQRALAVELGVALR
jgi:CBS domain-containing protein